MGQEEKEAEIKIPEEEKTKLFRLSEISVHIDTYDDIFSDFDARPYSLRAISDDLLLELRRACKVKPSGALEIRFLLPESIRNRMHESLIKRRLKEYFKKHHEISHAEIRKIRNKSFKFIGAGAIFSLLATYLLSSELINLSNEVGNFFIHLAIVLLEPAGWFSIWTGLERLVAIREERKEDLDFYDRMTKAEFHFTTY